MVKIANTGFLIVALSLISLDPTYGETPLEKDSQDPTKAVEYFQSELAFTTNANFVSKVVRDKIPNITIVDVRSAKAFAKGHIPGAINLPDEEYNSFKGAETEFPGLRKDGINIVYCYTQTCNLAQKAALKFASLGYPVKEMVGGYEAWVKRPENQVETGPSK